MSLSAEYIYPGIWCYALLHSVKQGRIQLHGGRPPPPYRQQLTLVSITPQVDAGDEEKWRSGRHSPDHQRAMRREEAPGRWRLVGLTVGRAQVLLITFKQQLGLFEKTPRRHRRNFFFFYWQRKDMWASLSTASLRALNMMLFGSPAAKGTSVLERPP